MDGDEAILRVCVDLNVWISHLLSVASGTKPDAAPSVVVRSVQAGRATSGPIQLVVSYTMLSRLTQVLVRKGLRPEDAEAYTSGIVKFANRGPALENPYVVLGGGVEPTAESRDKRYDPYDQKVVPTRHDDEDGRVIDTVIGGRADLLVTLNFADFRAHNDEIIEDGYIHRRSAAHHQFLIMHANRAAQWFRTGNFPWPEPSPIRDYGSGFP